MVQATLPHCFRLTEFMIFSSFETWRIQKKFKIIAIQPSILSVDLSFECLAILYRQRQLARSSYSLSFSIYLWAERFIPKSTFSITVIRCHKSCIAKFKLLDRSTHFTFASISYSFIGVLKIMDYSSCHDAVTVVYQKHFCISTACIICGHRKNV